MSYYGDGNRFICGIRRYEKHRNSVPDKPINAVLHNENNKRLEQLMAERSLQDKGVFEHIPHYSSHNQLQKSASNIIQNIPTNTILYNINNNNKHNNNTNQNVNNNIISVDKENRVIDFDTYLKVD